MNNETGKAKKIALTILTHVFLMALVLIIILPVIWLIVNSLKTNQEMFINSMALPKVPQFVNYATAWGKGLYNYFVSSVITSGISIFFILLISTMLAYGLTRFDLKGKDIIFLIVLGGMALSEQVALVPLFKIIRMLHLYDTRAAIILPYIAFRIPFTMFLLRSYFISIPKEVEEAAIIDGASTFQIFHSIIIPMSRPVLASAAIVNLNFVWNEFLFANVFLESKKLMTIPLGLMSFQGDLKSDYVTMLAGILIASLPMIILYICMQKQFVRGLSAGAVKG